MDSISNKLPCTAQVSELYSPQGTHMAPVKPTFPKLENVTVHLTIISAPSCSCNCLDFNVYQIGNKEEENKNSRISCVARQREKMTWESSLDVSTLIAILSTIGPDRFCDMVLLILWPYLLTSCRLPLFSLCYEIKIFCPKYLMWSSVNFRLT